MEEILRRALKQPGGSGDPSGGNELTHAELLEAAIEAGIDPKAVEAAAVELRGEGGRAQIKADLVDFRRKKFRRALGTFLAICGFLTAIDLVTGPGWWVHFVWLGYGLLMTLRGMNLLSAPNEHAVDKEIGRRGKAVRRKRRKEQHEEFERAVEDGVTALVAAVKRVANPAEGAGMSRTAAARPPPQVRVEDHRGAEPAREEVGADNDGRASRSK
jgi:hypothetical protein